MTGLDSESATPNTTIPIKSVDPALSVVKKSPPTAMPARIDILDTGAMRKRDRFPVSFSQYSWDAMLHNMLSQKAVIAPPRITNPMNSSGAFMNL